MSPLDVILLPVVAIIAIAGPSLERWSIRLGRSRVEISRWVALAQTIWWVVSAFINLRHPNMPFAIVDVIGAALWGHLAWELWRRNRKPRSERATGRVVDLGHRLTVRVEASR